MRGLYEKIISSGADGCTFRVPNPVEDAAPNERRVTVYIPKDKVTDIRSLAVGDALPVDKDLTIKKVAYNAFQAIRGSQEVRFEY